MSEDQDSKLTTRYFSKLLDAIIPIRCENDGHDKKYELMAAVERSRADEKNERIISRNQ
jgi:hypothetical protein